MSGVVIVGELSEKFIPFSISNRSTDELRIQNAILHASWSFSLLSSGASFSHLSCCYAGMCMPAMGKGAPTITFAFDDRNNCLMVGVDTIEDKVSAESHLARATSVRIERHYRKFMRPVATHITLQNADHLMGLAKDIEEDGGKSNK